MKNFYFVIVLNENGKKYAFMCSASENDNLLKKLYFSNAETINIRPTKKQAVHDVYNYNAIFKANGVYMFDTPTF